VPLQFSPKVARANAIFIIDGLGHCTILFIIYKFISYTLYSEDDNQSTNINEEIKERTKEQMRQYSNKKKEKVNKPKSSVIGFPRIYTGLQSNKKGRALGDIIRKTENDASSNQRDVNSITRLRP